MKPVRLSTQENRNLCCETHPKTFITKLVTGGGGMNFVKYML